MTYGFLLESIWHPPLLMEETADVRLPSELELQALWFSGAFGREFVTTDRRPVRIVQFGEWNRAAGPDFHHVAVEVAGETRTGSLEIDVSAVQWQQHGHADNESFRDVVLHVSFQAASPGTFVRTCENREIPQVVITGDSLHDGLNRPLREVAIAHPGRCLRPLRGMPAGSIERLLREAAIHRATRKARRMVRSADVHGVDAALFQAVAETLGYRHNRLPMRILAQRAPLAMLKREGDDAEAILFGSAGFLEPGLHELAPEDTRDYLRSLWDRWWKSRFRYESDGTRGLPWRFHGQRPANHPHRRLGALCALLPVWTDFRKLALARPFSVKPVVDFLQALDHPFWTRRHTLTSEITPGRISLVGRNHGLELVANHLIPLALLEDGMDWKGYSRLRHSGANDQVKRCALRLFGSMKAAEPWLKRLAHHQALLQIYQDFCLEDVTDCADCPFPEQLSQWR